MASIAVDTLKFTKRWKSAGLPAAQAEAIAEAFGEATGTELVTKDYLNAEIETAKNDLVNSAAGLLLAQAGLVTALVKVPTPRTRWPRDLTPVSAPRTPTPE